MELRLTITDEREAIREALLLFVDDLVEVRGYDLTAVVAELLFVSAAVVGDRSAGIKINSSLVDGELRDDDDPEEEELDEESLLEESWWDIQTKLDKMPIGKSIRSLALKAEKYRKLDRHRDSISVKRQLLRKYVEHAAAWFELSKGNGPYYTEFQFVAEDVLRASATAGDREAMAELRQLGSQLGAILPDDIFDAEVFSHLVDKFEADLATFERVCDYVKDNAWCQQKALYRQLSLDGTKVRYLFTWAESLGILQRRRNGDNWELSIVDQNWGNQTAPA